MKRNLSGVAKYFIIFSIQFIITVCLLEIGLRMLEPYNHNLRVLLYNPNSLGEYEQINTLEALLNTRPRGFKAYVKNRIGFILNSRSFSTKEYSGGKPQGYYRILAIGDSFTAGSGGVPHSQHWAVLLEKYLKSTVSDKIDVIKLGVGGVGPRFELRLWQLEGKKLEADLVVLAFCIGNDFTDEQGNDTPNSWFHSFTESSYMVRLVYNLYRLRGVSRSAEIMMSDQTDSNQRGGYETQGYIYDPNQATFVRPTFLNVVSSRMAITHKASHALFAAKFANLKPVLSLFRDSVISSNAKFVVMMIPDEYQVYPSLLEEAAHHLKRKANDYNVSLPQTQLSQFFQENNIEYLDLLPSFIQQGKSKTLYRLQNTHWNIEGNQLAATILTEYLTKFVEPYN